MKSPPQISCLKLNHIFFTDNCDESEGQVGKAATWSRKEHGFSMQLDSRQGEPFILNTLIDSDSCEFIDGNGLNKEDRLEEDVLTVFNNDTTCKQVCRVTDINGNVKSPLKHVDIDSSNVATCNTGDKINSVKNKTAEVNAVTANVNIVTSCVTTCVNEEHINSVTTEDAPVHSVIMVMEDVNGVQSEVIASKSTEEITSVTNIAAQSDATVSKEFK